jgi:hypothetical protein
MMHQNANKHVGCIGEGCPICPKLDLPGYEHVRANLMPEERPTRQHPGFSSPLLVQEGPGTELKRLLESLGVHNVENCSCRERMEEMNRWGVAGCKERRNEIVDWMREGAPRFGWSVVVGAAFKAVTLGLAFKLDWLDPFPAIADEAILRAEKLEGVAATPIIQ